MTIRILFVCLGNTCRSPAAEGVFAKLAKAAGLEVALDSAGTSGWHPGAPPSGPMQKAARARGHDLSHLRARAFTAADFAAFDLIIGMDGDNIADIERLRPPGATTPVKLFTDFAPETGASHVPDPYYSGDYEGALDLIEACAAGLASSLSR